MLRGAAPVGTSIAALLAIATAQPAYSAAPADGCHLLPGEQVAEVLGAGVSSATPWPLAGKFACMYESDAIPGVDLLVNVTVAGPQVKQQYTQDVAMLHNHTPLPGVGDAAAWSSERMGTMVSDALVVRSGSDIVQVSFAGSPKAPPNGDDDLKRARALALRALANAKASGM